MSTTWVIYREVYKAKFRASFGRLFCRVFGHRCTKTEWVSHRTGELDHICITECSRCLFPERRINVLDRRKCSDWLEPGKVEAITF